MKPASTTQLHVALVEPVAPAPRRAPRGRRGRRSRTPRSRRPRARRALEPAGAPRLLAATATISTPSRPCTCRAAPGGWCPHRRSRTATRKLTPRDAGQHRVRPAGRLEPALARSARRRAPGCRPGACATRCRRRAGRRRSCAGSSCVRAPCRISAQVVRPTAGCALAGHRDDRVVEVADLDRDRAAAPRARRPASQTSQQAAARAPARRRAVAEVAQDRLAAAAVLLDVGPDLAVLAPARARALLDRGRGTAPRRGRRSGRAPARRSGRAPTGDGAITPARVRWPSSARSRSPSPRSCARELARVERVAAVAVRGRSDPVGQPARQLRVDLLALDEVDVERLVAVLGEQQRPRRRAVAPRAARLLVVGLERRRHARVQHGATLGLSTPMPNALVAQITRTSSARKRRCTSARRPRSSPAW